MLRRVVVIAIVAFVVPRAVAAGEALSCPAGPGDASGGSPVAETRLPTPFSRPEATVPPAKRTARGLYLTAVDAFDMVSEDPGSVLFLDVRTRGELQFIGMPMLVDAQVPFLIEATPLAWDEVSSSFKLIPKPDFVAAVDARLARKGLARDAPVILLCQGGTRAARAADVLTRAGYATVYSVVDGFEGDPVAEGPNKGQRLVNGWRNAGLPWSARLDRAKMYGFD